MASTLTKDQIRALLGRPLSELEDNNFDLYLNIAKIRLDGLVCQEIDELDPLPDDLALVWAQFFGALTDGQHHESGISSKKVEDFAIDYREGYDPLSEVIAQNSATLAKYSKCESGVRHGKVMPVVELPEGYDDSV
jgi:hypothetical protein